MARTVRHKDFVIQIFELQTGGWRAEVRSIDGSRITHLDKEYETLHWDFQTADEAEEGAKQMIDRGGLSIKRP